MQPPGFLICLALLDAFINAAVSFQQLLVMLLDIRDDSVELLVRQTGHGSADVVEVVATVKIVKDIHHRQAMPFNLGYVASLCTKWQCGNVAMLLLRNVT